MTTERTAVEPPDAGLLESVFGTGPDLRGTTRILWVASGPTRVLNKQRNVKHVRSPSCIPGAGKSRAERGFGSRL